MVGQDAQVQHFGIADEHRGRVAPDFATEMIRGVAVIQGGGGAGVLGPCGCQGVEGGKLVLRQGLERKKIEGARVGVAQMALQHGQVVDEAFAAGRGRGRHNGVPRANVVRGQRLMAVQSGDAALLKDAADGRGPGQARLRVLRLGGGQQAVASDLPAKPFRSQQGGNIGTDRHLRFHAGDVHRGKGH